MLSQTSNSLYFLEKDIKAKTKYSDFTQKAKKSHILLVGTLWLFEANKDL